MMLAIARMTSNAMAKRIELTSSTKCLMARRLDFDCKPDVVTLIQTPTGQQKRVETLAVASTDVPPFSCSRAGLLGSARDRLRSMGDSRRVPPGTAGR